jgi:hypothetical protein
MVASATRNGLATKMLEVTADDDYWRMIAYNNQNKIRIHVTC